jgi:N-ethylmaleimide reductase
MDRKAIPSETIMLYAGAGVVSFPTPRALKIEQIPNMVGQFAEGAQNAVASGFDGVEVHTASGYPIDQSLRDGPNRCSDAYGGTRANCAETRSMLAPCTIYAVVDRL